MPSPVGSQTANGPYHDLINTPLEKTEKRQTSHTTFPHRAHSILAGPSVENFTQRSYRAPFVFSDLESQSFES